MLKYIRNLILKIAAQALILQICANLIILNRFNVSPISYGESFLFCVCLTVLTYSFVTDGIFSNTSLIAKSISNLSLLQLNANTFLLQQLDSIYKSIEEIKNTKENYNPNNETVNEIQIANKHNVPLLSIKDQLEIGIKYELQHAPNEKIAREIALIHLMEHPEYYSDINNTDNKSAKK